MCAHYMVQESCHYTLVELIIHPQVFSNTLIEGIFKVVEKIMSSLILTLLKDDLQHLSRKCKSCLTYFHSNFYINFPSVVLSVLWSTKRLY